MEYEDMSNTFRRFRLLSVFTDTWCSSGTIAPGSTLI
jgi:hypothetical protein